ncbi:MAG: hypothetical protein HYV93_01545 [Candidatus Rokubacteria bacterium]|nr:hypothetical protein [Candidatus Rokubacteria bacterium]
MVKARALASVYGFAPLVLLARNSRWAEPYRRVFESFGVRDFDGVHLHYYSPLALLRYLPQALVQLARLRTADDVLRFSVDGIPMGDLIYDEVLRNTPGTYTVRGRSLALLRALLAFNGMYVKARRLFQRRDVRYLLMSHVSYVRFGVLCRVAGARNVPVIRDYRRYAGVEDLREHFRQPDPATIAGLAEHMGEECERFADDYLSRRLAGKVMDSQAGTRTAYAGKRRYSRDELFGRVGMDPGKALVVVLPHIFSDAPRNDVGMIYRDFYEWFVDTLAVAREVEDVNWLIKEHPSARLYREEGLTATVVRRCGGRNIFVAPPDLHTASAALEARCLVMVRGTAMVEYGCLGIPTVKAGRSFYRDLGYAYDTSSVAEYRELLRRTGQLPRLTPEQIQMAKATLFWREVCTTIPSRIVPPNRASLDPREREAGESRNFQHMAEWVEHPPNPLASDPFYRSFEQFAARDDRRFWLEVPESVHVAAGRD